MALQTFANGESGLSVRTKINANFTELFNRTQASVLDFGAVGDGSTNSSTAIQSGIDALSADGGGTLVFPTGHFRAAAINFKPNVRIIGAGLSTIFHLVAGSNAGSLPVIGVAQSLTTSDPANNIRGIELSHMEIRGNCDSEGFAEFCHNIRLGGVTDAWFHHLYITRFSGDGFYLGSGEIGGSERHNENVLVEDCIFDGFDFNNRNGVSILDGLGVFIERNKFINCSRVGNPAYAGGAYDVLDPTAGPGMPGPIDLEPDDLVFTRLQNIHIRNNTLYNVGGNFAKIGALLPRANAALTNPIRDIFIEGNWIVQGSAFSPANLDVGISVAQREDKSAASALPNNVHISNNTVIGGDRGFDLRGVKEVEVDHNHFFRQENPSFVGFTNALDTTSDVNIHDNTFYECGIVDGRAVQLVRSDRTSIEGNTFDNTGKTDNSLGQCILANSSPGATRIKIRKNKFISRGRTTAWAVVESATPEANEVADNSFEFSGSAPLFNVRSMKTDILDTNATVPGFTLATLPDAFPVGTSRAYVNNDATAPSTVKFGVLTTERFFLAGGSARRFITQTFKPVDADDELIYTRTGDSASNAWLPWRVFTGV